MITYEQAKKLKDAGFPQPKTKGFLDIFAPTLSDLIKKCGKYVNLFQLEDGWGASKSQNGFDLVFTLGEHTVGSTPEEAVANLWLAINKK